jgi:hypothetical protein
MSRKAEGKVKNILNKILKKKCNLMETKRVGEIFGVFFGVKVRPCRLLSMF